MQLPAASEECNINIHYIVSVIDKKLNTPLFKRLLETVIK